MESEGKAPGYIAGMVKSVKSWLSYNDIHLKRKIKISNRGATPTLDEERIPSKRELKALLTAGDERTGAIICLVAMSGVRPQVLGNDRGDDGLTIRDLPVLKVDGGGVEFTRVPAMVLVRPSLNKSNHQYFTFLSREGCDYLATYLELRLSEGEKLSLETPLIASKSSYARSKEPSFMTTKNISRIIRLAMRPRFKWRPYVLRSYFDTNMLYAESQGKIIHSYTAFFMGHSGDIEARYTTNKGQLPEEMVEDMRESYRKCQEYLQTEKTLETSEEKLRYSFRKQLLLVAGFDGEEIDGMDLSMDDEEFQETVRKKLVGSMINNGASQRVVPINDLEGYLSDGWDFVAKLTEDKAVVKIP
jgi:hypothetical protein